MKQKLSYFLTALMCILGTSAWALEKDADGIYQIGTAEDLVAFSELVNGGETSANAVLTADIDLSAIEAFPPIGTYSDNGIDLAYRGTFDGKGHVVKNLKVNVNDTQEAGLFSRLFAAAVRNLGIVNASVTNGANVRAGVFAGEIHVSNVFNCFTAGDLTVETSHIQKCGFAGEAAGSNLYNCYTTHDIFSNDGNKVNCYWGEGTISKAPTGELCFLLNGNQRDIVWYQTLGEDQYPVLDPAHGVVYTTAEMRCDGQLLGEGTYTNDASLGTKLPDHKYENGICTVCGQKDPDYTLPRDEEGFCLIENAAQLVWFADLVNGGETSLFGRLTADIDMTGYNEKFTPIGSDSKKYSGTFDGQGHRIKNLHITFMQDCAGLFSYIESPAVIKNLILDESCTIEGGGNTGGLIGRAGGAQGPILMENLGMEGTIHLTGYNGAGIIGNNQGSVANFTIRNCYVTGSITAEGGYSGAITGYAGPGAVFENCWVTGEVHGTDGPGTYFIRGLESGTITNCYSKYGTQVTTIDDTQVEGGELCYLLNSGQEETVWFQKIGEDPHPVLDASRGQVYPTAERRCDGKVIGSGAYTNDASRASVIPDHTYENGICSVCGQKQEGFMEPDAEGFYNIGEASELVWFASAVNNGGAALNGRLTADIDMNDYNEFFQPIGSETLLYKGTFDGQGHRISNLYVSADRNCVGLFGAVTSPAVIKNLILDETCSIEGTGHYCALVGSARGSGPVCLENLGMEGSVHAGGWNAAGIVGNNMDAFTVTLSVRNCYVTGNVKADGRYSGLITGYGGFNALFENCWGTGEVDGADGDGNYFIRGMESGVIRNCYSKNGTQVNPLTDIQVENGELCYKLNGESFVNPSWYQTLGEDLHPVFDATHGLVYKAGEEYGDVHDEASFDEFKSAFLASEKEYCETVVAEQALIDQYMERIEATEGCQTMEEFAKAYDEINSVKALVVSSAQAYSALKAKGDEVMAYLEEHDDFEGEKRDLLEEYLKGYVEPCEQFPNGSLTFIMETHTMNEAGAKGETARIGQMLEEAIATGFRPHSNITSLLTNADFSSGWNGWEGTLGNATSSPAAECKNSTCDFHQTLTDLKDGIYELQVNGFFRPGNPTNGAGNPTSTNYGAFFYLNDMQNYLMAAIEDMIGANEAVDGENCFITEGASWTDISIYNDNGELLGYVPGGQGGMKIAAQAGRYQNRILVNVTDGTLTVGFRQPGTGVANDCMDITNLKLFYHGTLEEASAEVDEALACMAARAQTLYDYEASSGMDYAENPNFDAGLREALKAAIDAVGTTTDVEGKYALMGTFSSLFQQVYESKRVYASLMDQAETLITLSDALASMLTEEDVEKINKAVAAVYEAYIAGTATAGMMDEVTNRLTFLPKQENGVYQLANGKDLQMFSLIVNNGVSDASAVLTADIDMTEYSRDFQPIGNASTKYSGTFDGQGHRIKNLNISLPQERVGLFGVIQSPAVIRDFIIDASCTIEGGGNYGGIIGSGWGNRGPVRLEKLGMEGTIHLTGWNGGGIIGNNQDNTVNIHMSNCYVSGNVTAEGGYSGALTGWAGAGAAFENCWVIGQVSGTDSDGTYFIRGLDSGTIKNCYSKYGTQVNPLTDEQVASGELCYLLNGDQSEIVWYQNIGEDPHPVFDATHKTVVKNEDGSYDNITAIETVQSEESNARRDIYDLSGRKISGTKLSKGIYIINGKKVAIK